MYVIMQAIDVDLQHAMPGFYFTFDAYSPKASRCSRLFPRGPSISQVIKK